MDNLQEIVGMKNELLALAIFLVVIVMFIRTALNKIYPNLFGKTARLIKKIAILLLKISLWLIVSLLSLILPLNSPQKKLPGRKR